MKDQHLKHYYRTLTLSLQARLPLLSGIFIWRELWAEALNHSSRRLLTTTFGYLWMGLTSYLKHVNKLALSISDLVERKGKIQLKSVQRPAVWAYLGRKGSSKSQRIGL